MRVRMLIEPWSLHKGSLGFSGPLEGHSQHDGTSTCPPPEQGSGDWPEYRHSGCFAESSRAPTPPPLVAPFGTQVVGELENKWFSRSCRRALKCTAAKGMPAARAGEMAPSLEGDAQGSVPIPSARDAGFPLAAVHFSARRQEITKITYFPAPEPLVCRTEPLVGAGRGWGLVATGYPTRIQGHAAKIPDPC